VCILSHILAKHSNGNTQDHGQPRPLDAYKEHASRPVRPLEGLSEHKVGSTCVKTKQSPLYHAIHSVRKSEKNSWCESMTVTNRVGTQSSSAKRAASARHSTISGGEEDEEYGRVLIRHPPAPSASQRLSVEREPKSDGGTRHIVVKPKH
jgi:hypothetical protein